MKLKPQDLTDNGYVLLETLGHKELIPFVRTYLGKRTLIYWIYTCSNIIIAAFIVFWFYRHYGTFGFKIGAGFTSFSYGIALAFALIPIHEYIHVLAYRSQGANKTSYDVNWKKFYFMAIADRFVANKKEFRIIALAPVAVISTLLLVLFFVVGQLGSFTILGILLTHTAFSSGDFGIVNYFEFHKDTDIVTYDDKENHISFFYGKPKMVK